MTRKSLGLLLTFSLAVNAAFLGAWITQNLPEEPAPQPANTTTLWDDLELDPQQEDRLRVHWDELGSEAADISAELDEDRQELFALLKQEEPDIEAIVELQQAIGQKQERLREMAVLKMLEVSRELDPKARRKWATQMHDYARERSRRKPWRRPGHHLHHRGRPGRRDIERLLRSGDVRVNSQTIERGVELQFRTDDPEDVDRLHEELPEWLRGKRKGDAPQTQRRQQHRREEPGRRGQR